MTPRQLGLTKGDPDVEAHALSTKPGVQRTVTPYAPALIVRSFDNREAQTCGVTTGLNLQIKLGITSYKFYL